MAAASLAAGICCAHNVTIVNRDSQALDGYLQLSNGDVVTPLLGHLVLPRYLSEIQRESRIDSYFDFLPVVVKEFEYEPKYERNANGEIRIIAGKQVPIRQYLVVTRLMRDALEIVNASEKDPDGQLIVDELLMHCGIDPEGKDKPIWRLSLVSNRAEDISKQVLNIVERNGDAKWVRRRHSALARAHCDTAVNLNSSMAYQAASGYRRTSLGRVQTPVLCLVVAREEQVRSFKPRDYYIPTVTLADGTELKFSKRANYQGQEGFDEEGRIIDADLAKNICLDIEAGLVGVVSVSKKVAGIENPPLPYSATVLASTVSKRTGMLPKQAEHAACSLYESHKVITSNGTDSRYLPSSMLDDVRQTMTTLSKLFPQQVNGIDLDLRSKAWNDEKSHEDAAIVPTRKLPANTTREERAVYDAVAMRYIVQFYPPYEYTTSQLVAVFGDDEFKAASRETVCFGWKEIEGHLEQGGPSSDAAANDATCGEKIDVDSYRPGMVVSAVKAGYKKCRTTPPERFDMATLLDAMLAPDRVSKVDAEHVNALRVVGIGTARTRLGFVDALIQRGLLYTERKGNRYELKPHEVAVELRSRLPPILSDLAMTAKWEVGFAMVEKGVVDWRRLVEGTYSYVNQIVEYAKTQKGNFNLGANQCGVAETVRKRA